jgi:hypothetical protein
MSYSSPFVQGHTTPRRPSTSGGRSGTSFTTPRPSTSSGEAIEPQSAYLRDALRDFRGTPGRARSTTPRRQRPGFRSLSYKDEWLHSSGDEKQPKEKSVPQRPTRQRRASELPTPQSAGPSSQLGARATGNKLDKLEKENWDLKHRIMLYQENAQRQNARVEALEADGENLRIAKERIEDLSRELDKMSDQLYAERDTNNELNQINDELVQQLEERDRQQEQTQKDAFDRQGAIVEAAGIIQSLESKLQELEIQMSSYHQQRTMTRGDSDYYSAEPELVHHQPVLKASKPPLGDSDYFSADTSPLVTPKTMMDHVARSTNEASPSFNAAQSMSAAFNREVGIRFQTSNCSLFSAYLESPKLPEPQQQPNPVSSRILRLRSLRKRTQSPKPSKHAEPGSGKKQQSQVHTDSRPLRNLYKTGELAVQVNSNARPIPPAAPSDRSSIASPYSSSPDDVILGMALGGPKASSTPSILAVPASPTTPKKSAVSPGVHSRLVHIRSNSTNSRPVQPLLRQQTSPATMTSSKPKLSPARAMSERRESVHSMDGHRPQSLVSTSSSHARSPRSPSHQSQLRTSTASPATVQDAEQSKTSSKNSLPMTSPTYATPQAQTAPTYSATKPTTRTHRSPPTPNFSHWPRRYPAWPPSAGLVNRDLLFHGEGMDEMFPEGENSP